MAEGMEAGLRGRPIMNNVVELRFGLLPDGSQQREHGRERVLRGDGIIGIDFCRAASPFSVQRLGRNFFLHPPDR
jgi:hypothetical protein